MKRQGISRKSYSVLNQTILVVKVLILHRNKLLLVYRNPSKPWHTAEWTVPGGHVEKGEDCVVAAIREAKEETGLNIKIKSISRIRDYPAAEKDTQMIAVTFVAQANQSKVILSNEHSAFKWVRLNEKMPAKVAEELSYLK